jgi:hypothetical protein
MATMLVIDGTKYNANLSGRSACAECAVTVTVDLGPGSVVLSGGECHH